MSLKEDQKNFKLISSQFMAPRQDANLTHYSINSFLSIRKRFINLTELYKQHSIPMKEVAGSGNKNTYIFR